MSYRTKRIGKKHKLVQARAAKNFSAGLLLLKNHPLFEPIMDHIYCGNNDNICPSNGWVVITSAGCLQANIERLAPPEAWAYIIAHAILHLVFGHFRQVEKPLEWATACDVYVTRFLQSLKIGAAPAPFNANLELPGLSEEKLYEKFCHEGAPAEFCHLGTAGPFHMDCLISEPAKTHSGRPIDWQAAFALGLENAVRSAVNVAGGLESHLGSSACEHKITKARQARAWLISSYPLLGSLAAAFDLIEDPELCARLRVPIAAVHAETREIYINSASLKDEQEYRFVMAHEFLHVGLRHHLRCQGRDHFLWNIACDYVINGWLIEMGVGELPAAGALYDPELKGLSAEAVYDRIVIDMRRFRKLATLRGNCGCGDIIDENPEWWSKPEGMSLDEFYRRCLAQGLGFHESQGRGFLPSGLVEEIRALSQPPIAWDVELAQWFDRYFPPLEKYRTYSRPSRRQASTPDIPRPSYCPDKPDSARTFAVVLDTSGSMDRELLGKALGAIASYSMARDVPFARVVFCDAVAYDEGYMAPEAIASRVKVKGRGGTVLQPAIDLLERAEDFPKAGPMLIITDGWCDRLVIRREHAFLMPEAAQLPFNPKGKVFRVK